MSWLLVAMVVLLVPRGRRLRLRSRSTASRSQRVVRFDTLGAAAAFLAAAMLLPLPWGLVVGGGAAALAKRSLPETFSRPDEKRRLAISRRLPDAVDLVAALLRAGIPDGAALAMVVSATEGPLADCLAVVAGHRRLGASPAEAWRCVAAEPQLADFAAAMARHADTGAPIAAVLDRVAADARRDYFAKAQAAARSAAVRAVIPLAACFLPAFVLVGIVPVVASLLSGLSF